MRKTIVVPSIALFVVAVLAFAAWRIAPQTPIAPVMQEERSVAMSNGVPAPALKVNLPEGVNHSATAAVGASARATASAPRIARTGAIDLYVDGVDDAVASLSALARRFGGDVFALQLEHATDSNTAATATMQIRVPADRFDATMDAVGRSGKVRERTIAAQDLTADITDSQARLTNLRQTEVDIRHIMDREGEISDVLEAENQLSEVRGQIETLESQLKSMRAQVTYATIGVTLQAEAGTSPVGPPALAQLSTAWRNAVHSVSQMTITIAASLLWLVAFAPYILLAGLAVLLVFGRLRRIRA